MRTSVIHSNIFTYTTSNITQETQNSELYGAIERNLMNAGFIVRDRAMLEKLLINEQLSYESIAEKIKVDLIIEVMDNSHKYVTPTTMFREKNDKQINITTEDRLYIQTSQFAFRIVLAKTGAVSGIFTFYYNPCVNRCVVYARKHAGLGCYWFGRSKTEVNSRMNQPLYRLNSRDYYWYNQGDYIITDLSNKIINILQGK